MADNGPLPGATIDTLKVEIVGDASQLTGTLRSAESQTAATGQRMAQNLGAGTVVGRGGVFDSIGKTIKDSTAGLRGAVGAVTAVIGTASRLLGIVGLVSSGAYLVNAAFTAIRGGASGAADEAERMKKNLADAEVVGDRLKKELREAQELLRTTTTNPQAVDPAAINEAQKAVTDKSIEITRNEQLIRAYKEQLKESTDLADKRALSAQIAIAKEELVRFREEIKILEAIRDNLVHGRNDAFRDIINAATAKILAMQKEQTNKLLENIAISSARAQQLAEQMSNSQHRGP